MNRIFVYVLVWAVMVAGTLLQVVIFNSSATANLKNLGVVAIAVAEILLAATFYLNLRYEPKILALFPILAILAVVVFITAATLAVGM
ncbi:MAG: hypothetical protein NWE98_01605 [Candidatus Bathyarchaeota archaeon]|nr:hypothetical protein [Candidatus Bathyarchaeota archaeon]